MATDLTVSLDDRPGGAASIAEAMGKAGINMDGGFGYVIGDKGIMHVLVADGDAATARDALVAAGLSVEEDQEAIVSPINDTPGELGRITRQIADAGVNLKFLYLATGTRLVVAGDDMEKLKDLLG